MLVTSVSLFAGMQIQGSEKREYKESANEYISSKRLKTIASEKGMRATPGAELTYPRLEQAIIEGDAAKLQEALKGLDEDRGVDEILKVDPVFWYAIFNPDLPQSANMKDMVAVLKNELSSEALYKVLCGRKGYSLLHIANEYKCFDTIKELFDAIKSKSSEAITSTRLYELIVNIRNKDGKSLWELSAENSELRALLEQYTNGPTPKTYLIDAVNEGGENGAKKIQQALEGKTLEEKFYLISTLRCFEGKTLLDIAFWKRDYEVAQVLTQDFSGEQLCTLLSQQDNYDNAVLHQLVDSSNCDEKWEELLATLLGRLNATQTKELAYLVDRDNKTPLFYARTPEMIKIVLNMIPQDEWDTYITLEDNDGFTVLTSLSNGNWSAIQAVLDYANNNEFILTKPNKYGETPLLVVLSGYLRALYDVADTSSSWGQTLPGLLETVDFLLGWIHDPALLRHLIKDKNSRRRSVWDYAIYYKDQCPELYDKLQRYLDKADELEAALQKELKASKQKS